MREFFAKNTKLLLIVLVLIVISLTAYGIYLINNNSFNSVSLLGSNLKNFAPLKEKFISLKLANDSIQTETVIEFNKLEDKNTSTDIRYKALVRAVFLLSGSYSRNSDPKVYNFITKDLNTFTNDNFKKN